MMPEKSPIVMGLPVRKRQTYDINDTGAGADYSWNYSITAVIIKWAIIGALVLFVVLWFVGGYYHAQRRIKKGKRPLAYHMFLVPRRQRLQFFPRPNPPFYPRQGVYGPQEYPLQAYPPPPPAYNAENYAPPQYQPPEGGSKVRPEQDYTAPPPGAPPRDLERAESSNAGANSSDGVARGSIGSATHGEMHGGLPPAEGPKPGIMPRKNSFNYGSAGPST